ncbi:PRTRC system protein E [Cupriavidus sp. SW-Y-13]|uniref:PRTRC system protein E n=1 Tax=Cupriavidus sp. SW-Y-13 TaxID=2653854 RepID=UPI0013659AEE|nr:PRTRC system protein E [Cupriavidus sp. SW-Y-13]MWL91398.1 PRTRC system protein E [Cupriavidus sp. SW-Y-13]
MFTELAPLVRAADKVVLTLSMTGEAMTVVVMPVIKNAADAALTTPLSLTATPAELDAEFAATLTGVTNSHRSLAEQAEATKSILDAAKSTQSTKATKALAKAATPSGGAAADGNDDDEDDAGTPPVEAKAEAKADTAAPANTGTDLASLL